MAESIAAAHDAGDERVASSSSDESGRPAVRRRLSDPGVGIRVDAEDEEGEDALVLSRGAVDTVRRRSVTGAAATTPGPERSASHRARAESRVAEGAKAHIGVAEEVVVAL